MPIPDPLRSLQCESGGLVQTCPHCEWASRGHQWEIQACPACGEEVSSTLAIVFGGLAVIRSGRDFLVRDRQGPAVRLDAADCAAVAQFICRHTPDHRNGNTHDGVGPPRRIAYSKQIEDLLWPR